MQILKFFFDKNFCFASNFVNKITLFLVFLIFTCTKSFLLVSVLADTKHILDNKTDFDANDTIIVEKDVKVNITPSEYIMVNIFRPNDDKEHPVVISYGPYDKDLSMQITNPEVYKTIKNKHQYLHMCTANPLWWVSNGYVIINASQSGSGKSSGILRFTSKHIGKDYAELIHWASQRSWSNGNIGLIGISQYAINQLHAASFQPAGLKAIIVWQAYSDLYRDISRHGGILSNNFLKQWFQRRLFPNMNKENRNESCFLINKIF